MRGVEPVKKPVEKEESASCGPDQQLEDVSTVETFRASLRGLEKGAALTDPPPGAEPLSDPFFEEARNLWFHVAE